NKSSGVTSPRNQKMAENEFIVHEYNNYIHAITNMHQGTIEPINWREINNSPEPFSKDEIGPQQKDAAEKYNQYKPSFLEKVFKKLATKKQRELTQAITSAKKADEAKYRKWQQLTELASDVLDGDPEAYEQVIKNSHKFDDMRERSALHV